MKFVLKRFNLWPFLLLALLIPLSTTKAQEQQPSGPVYIVKEGDTLWDIALRFGVSLEELETYNGIANPSQLAVGDQLVIPGLEGVQGVLATKTVPYGENLRSLSRRYRAPVDALVRLNRLTSPAELYSGATLVIPESNAAAPSTRRVWLSSGQSLLELAVIEGTNPWTLVAANALNGTWDGLPGDVLRSPDGVADDGPGAFPAEITAIKTGSLPLAQGSTAVIQISATGELTAAGSFIEHELHFFEIEEGTLVALQGVHALTRPGFYPLVLSGALANGDPFAFSQWVYVRDADFIYESPLIVPPETIDPANTAPEDELWRGLPLPITPERMWDGIFQYPASPLFANCYPSLFGSRRSYNGGPYNYFHTGLDICGGVGAEVFAPAPGVVVYTGTLTVRGNAIMLDHGWGIYTSYEHLSEILVQVGDRVETGQLIGRVGGTGRVTGSHLHWEVWVSGVQVQPLDWLERAYP